jgi:hypothetical protein
VTVNTFVRVLVPAATLGLLAGCGSTVAPGAAGPAGSSGLSSVESGAGGLNGGTTTGTGVGTANGTGTSALGGASGSANSSGFGGAGANGTAGGSAGAIGTGVPGVSATQINVGIAYGTNADAVNQAAGFSGLDTGDEQGYAKAVVNDINKHGGIAGRKLNPIWHADNAEDTSPHASQDSAECADFTQDHHTFAVVALGFTNDFTACVTKSAIQIAGGDLSAWDEQDFATYPYLVDVDTLDLDSQMAALVPMLVHQGYFSGWDTTLGQASSTAKAKVGVVSFESPEWSHALNKVLLPALKSAGYPVSSSDVYTILSPQSESDQGPAVAEVQNAELRMHSDGVTHVILMDSNGGLTQIYSTAAYGQHWYPRYSLTSASGAQQLLAGGDLQPAEMNGSMGLGWEPTLDLPENETGDKSVWSTPARQRCIAVMRAVGITFPSTNGETIALNYCESLYFIQQVVDAIAPNITRANFMAEVDRLGYGFPAATVQKTYFGPGHHDSVILGYDMRYVPSCQCIGYKSNTPVTIP